MSDKPSSLRELYQATHSSALFEFFQTPAGRSLIPALSDMRGNISCKASEHDTVFAAGDIRGFERALQALMALTQPYHARKQVEATYGHPDPETKPKV